MTVNLKRWDASAIKPTSTVYICAPRGSGKSTLLKDVCYNIRKKIDFAVAFCPTADASNLREYLPRTCIYETYEKSVVEKLYETQRIQWKRGHGSTVALLFDDCAFDNSIFKQEIMKKLFLNGRHRHLFVVILSQYALQIPPAIRSNIDVVIVGADPSRTNRETIYKNFFGIVPTFKTFDTIFNEATKNFRFLALVNNNSRGNNLEDRMFWYLANPSLPRFRMLQDLYYELDKRFYVDEDVLGIRSSTVMAVDLK